MENYPFDDVTQEDAAEPVGPPRVSTPSRVRRIATGTAIGVAVLATGGVAVAATHSGGTTAQGGPGGGGPGGGSGGPGGNSESGTTGQGGPGGGRGFGGSGGAGGLGNALHGTFVVPAGSGTGTVTESLRTGKVTAVSATSIAVTSTDTTAGTFVITSATTVNRGQSTVSDVKVGDTVTVIATDTDKKALTIEDRSRAQTGGNGTAAGQPGGGSGAGQPGGGSGGPRGGTPPSGAPAATQGGETT